MTLTTSSLMAFSDHLRLANPFDDNRVTQVDSLTADVPEIHSSVFRKLCEHAEKACHLNKARGVVLSGSPGIGKSHLLARFGQWARGEKYPFIYLLNLQAGPQDIVRTILKATISILTRDFSRRPHRSRLYKIVSMAVRHAIKEYSPEQTLSISQGRALYYRLLHDHQRHGDIYNVLWQLFEDIQRLEIKLPRTGVASIALKWLSGDCLEPADAAKLGLNPADAGDEGYSLNIEGMKSVLRVLCEFTCYRNRSFILCFDQVDTLSEDQVQIWSATVHALLDSCPGLLVVTSGVDETFLRWTSRDLVSKASWDDRIRQFPLLLSGISAGSARELIQQRLSSSLERFRDTPELLALIQNEPYFPLDRQAVDAMLLERDGEEKNDLRPRDVISRAGAAWEKQHRLLQHQGLDRWLTVRQNLQSHDDSVDETVAESELNTAAEFSGDWFLPDASSSDEKTNRIDEVVRMKIEELRGARKSKPEELPVDSGNLVGLIGNLLKACLPQDIRTHYTSDFTTGSESASGEEVAPVDPEKTGNCRLRLTELMTPEPRGNTRPTFQLILKYLNAQSDHCRRLGVTVAEATSGLTATNMLKRIVAHFQEADAVDEALLVLDERAPLSLAATGKERLTELNGMPGRFTVFELSFDEYALLDALRSVAGLAQSGDLASRDEDGNLCPISEVDVYASLQRTGQLASSKLLSRLLNSPAPTQEPITNNQ